MDIGFLLFSSLLNPAEMFLSKELKNKHKSAKSKTHNLKSVISKPIGAKLDLFRKKEVNKTLETEIEVAIEDIKNPEHEDIINELLTKEIAEGFDPQLVKYENQVNKTSEEIKPLFKRLYQTFVSYAKGAYTKIKSASSNPAYVSRKIIEGPVRMTMAKFAKVFEYILAALNPGWNRPMGTAGDYDTLAPAETNHIVINNENLQYGSGYVAARYRSG